MIKEGAVMKKILQTARINPKLFWGSVLLALMVAVAVFGHLLCPNPPDYFYDDMLHPPSAQYPLGTDGLGSDMLTLIIYGTRTSLRIGILVALISCTIGTLVGGVSGYLGGITDRIISEVLNILMMIPTFFLIILAISLYGSNINNMILVMALTSWAGTARLMRGQALAIREKPFIKNAEVLGIGKMQIILRHVIPNCICPVLTNMAMTVSGAILSEAGLSFLGLGDSNVVSWGKLIAAGRAYLPSCWWICLFPGLAVVLTSLVFHMLSDGLNQAINARSHNS